uniref:WD40/YVTN/BNR-like repeat-containing protein n=1 Tax=Marinobacterium profundum TaxID=1714300 RepID=UPI00083520E8|nr:hypothetical protein [Marinobacterium profundum]
MNQACLIRKCKLALAIVALSGVFASDLITAGVKIQDVLDRPAKKLKNAVDSVQLSLTEAGERFVSVGEKGIILLSDDKGISWRQATSVPVSVTLTDVKFINSNVGFSTGHGGVLLTTVNGGENWDFKFDGRNIGEMYMRQAESTEDPALKAKALKQAEYLIQDGADKPLLNIDFVDSYFGVVTGAYGLAFKTTDGGATWIPLMLEVPNDGGMHLYDYVQAKGTEYLVGERGIFFKRDMNNEIFEEQKSPYNGSFFGALVDEKETILVYGLRGNLWGYLSGSEQWSQFEYPYDISITSAVKATSGNILLGDANGNIVQLESGISNSFRLVENIGSYVTDMIVHEGEIIVSTVRGNKRIEVGLLE